MNDVAVRLRMLGLAVHRTDHDGSVRLGAVGDGVPASTGTRCEAGPGVAAVEPIPVPFKLVSRAFQPHATR